MFLKNILRGAAFCGLLAMSSTKFAEAKYLDKATKELKDLKYSVGVSGGFGVFEYNESNFTTNRVTTSPGGPEVLRTTYKYVDNFPTKTLHIDFNISKSFQNIKVKDYNFFFGTEFDFGWGKQNPTKGLTNPNAYYMSAGTTNLFYALNTKFGLENKNYKMYGIAGLMYGKIDVPFDILPEGNAQLLGPLGTCTVFAPGSSLIDAIPSYVLLSVLGNNLSLADLQSDINAKCDKMSVKNTGVNTWFANLGAGFETNLTKKLSFVTEYIYMLQLSKGRVQSFDYTYDGTPYTFTGKMGILNSQYVKVGLRYYFN